MSQDNRKGGVSFKLEEGPSQMLDQSRKNSQASIKSIHEIANSPLMDKFKKAFMQKKLSTFKQLKQKIAQI